MCRYSTPSANSILERTEIHFNSRSDLKQIHEFRVLMMDETDVLPGSVAFTIGRLLAVGTGGPGSLADCLASTTAVPGGWGGGQRWFGSSQGHLFASGAPPRRWKALIHGLSANLNPGIQKETLSKKSANILDLEFGHSFFSWRYSTRAGGRIPVPAIPVNESPNSNRRRCVAA